MNRINKFIFKFKTADLALKSKRLSLWRNHQNQQQLSRTSSTPLHSTHTVALYSEMPKSLSNATFNRCPDRVLHIYMHMHTPRRRSPSVSTSKSIGY